MNIPKHVIDKKIRVKNYKFNVKRTFKYKNYNNHVI
jgi:hypothetical protein